jgi:hypothetical protein
VTASDKTRSRERNWNFMEIRKDNRQADGQTGEVGLATARKKGSYPYLNAIRETRPKIGFFRSPAEPV